MLPFYRSGSCIRERLQLHCPLDRSAWLFSRCLTPKCCPKLNSSFQPTNFFFLYFFSQLMAPPSTQWTKPEMCELSQTSLSLTRHYTKSYSVLFIKYFLNLTSSSPFLPPLLLFKLPPFLKLLQLSLNRSLWYQPCYLHIWVFYTAARMMCLKHNTDHVNPQLKNFQWFPTASRMKPRFLSKALMIPKHISVLVLTKFN